MRHTTSLSPLLVLVGGLFVSAGVWADPPSWAGGGHGHEQMDDRGPGQGHGMPPDRREDRRDDHRDHGQDDRGNRADFRFADQNRYAVRDYYGAELDRGHCPPGLAKKHNGCLPPGQARKWRMGQPLPRGVAVYALPPELVTRMGPPPSGYRYVRVASDILMVAVGTQMVVDAISDLGR